MARTISVIKQQIIDTKNGQASLAGLNSPSQTAIWNLWAYVTAVAINLFEQLLDIFTAQIEAYIAVAGIGTIPWLRVQVLKFQFSATTSQYVQLNTTTLVIAYPIIDPKLRILSRAAVSQQANRVVSVKVAQQEPPVQLTSPMFTALSSYLNEIAFAGTQINIINANADSLIASGTVFYTGQYAATIQSDVITALNSYCTGLSSNANFGSAVKATDVIKAILAVNGVTDFRPTEVSVRPDLVSITLRNKIFELSSGTDQVFFTPVSGYIIPEATAGWDFGTTLSFSPVS